MKLEVYDSIGAESLFSAMLTRSNGLEGLANAALQRGIDAYVQKDYKRAVADFKRAVGLGRGSAFAADAAQFLAMAYLALDDRENAVKAYRSGIQIDPYRDDLRVKLGNLYFADKNYEEAAGQYAEAVRVNPTAANRYALGQALIELGRYAEAEAQYNEIQRISPQEAGGYLGMGLLLRRKGEHTAAILQFERALALDGSLHEARLQIGFSRADLREIGEATEMARNLERLGQDGLAATLKDYIYRVDPPRMVLALSGSTFPFPMGRGTPVIALGSYLAQPNASKTLSIQIAFNKQMDRAAIENPANWRIGRAAGEGPGQAYNFGLPVPATEVTLSPLPTAVTWDDKNLTATVYFTVTQNAAANGTIDPAHIEFRFFGKDRYGLTMNPRYDQFTGFRGVY